MVTIELRTAPKNYSWRMAVASHSTHHYPHGKPAFESPDFSGKHYYLWGRYYGTTPPDNWKTHSDIIKHREIFESMYVRGR